MHYGQGSARLATHDNLQARSRPWWVADLHTV